METTTEAGMRPIVEGATALRAKADEMRAALDSVRAASDQTAHAAEGSRAMNDDATRLSEEVIRVIGEMVGHSTTSAVDVATVAIEMQRTSEQFAAKSPRSCGPR